MKNTEQGEINQYVVNFEHKENNKYIVSNGQ